MDETHPLAPADLAAEYVAAKAAGDPADLAAYLARLRDDAERAEFETLITDAERAQRSLPRVLTGGTLLGQRYRIVREIGGGGMGRVFEAWDSQLERKVAIKVLASHNVGRSEPEDLFRKEGKALASLQHPNIVAVHEFARDGDLAYIVMDLVDGTSMSEVLEHARKELEPLTARGAVSPREGRLLERAIGKPLPAGRASLIDVDDWYASVARIMLELARTVEAAHGLQFIHRDLKPGNVMLKAGGHPIVLDFGLAGTASPEPGVVTQGLYGSYAYLAPEQARSNAVGMDPRTDVYQLGLILYELLTLRRAFPGTVLVDVLARVTQGEFPRPRELNPAAPRDLESICMMALELDPARRYSSARALREDLERYVGGREAPIAVRSERWRAFARTSRYFVRRHRWRVSIAASLAAIVLIGVAVWKQTHDVVADSVRHSSAAAPVIAAFRVSERGTGKAMIEDGDNVYPGDLLGVTVSTNQAQFMYVLSVFCRRDGQRFLSPMRPEPIAEYLQGPSDKELPLCREVEPGRTDFVCARVGPASEQLNSIEGLLVITGPDKYREFDDWILLLDARSRNYSPKGVPEADAWEVLENPSRVRGDPAQDLTAEQRARYFPAMKTPSVARGKVVELTGLRTLELECPVANPR
jgi:hypothetical protein